MTDRKKALELLHRVQHDTGMAKFIFNKYCETIREALSEPVIDDGLREAVEHAKDDIDYCRVELKNDKSKKIGYADLTYSDLETLITHAIKGQSK